MASHSPQQHRRRPRRDRSRDDCAGLETEPALEALDDPDCRALLEAATGTARTAGELIELSGVPRSTTYRKLDRLVEAGLLEERVRISADGAHASEYTRTVGDIVVSISATGGVTVGAASSGSGGE